VLSPFSNKETCKGVFIQICVFLSFVFQHHNYRQIFNSNQFIFFINWSVYHYSKCAIIWSPSWRLKKFELYVKKDFNNILVNKNSIALNMFSLYQADSDKDLILILYHTNSLQPDLVTIPIFILEPIVYWTRNMFCRRLDLLNLELFIKKIQPDPKTYKF
jgi:hypothetical protein